MQRSLTALRTINKLTDHLSAHEVDVVQHHALPAAAYSKVTVARARARTSARRVGAAVVRVLGVAEGGTALQCDHRAHQLRVAPVH